jgi:hypothetical protein
MDADDENRELRKRGKKSLYLYRKSKLYIPRQQAGRQNTLN